MANDPHHSKPSWTERIETAGDQLATLNKALAIEGSTRRVSIIGLGGGAVLEMPMTISAIAGSAATPRAIRRTLAAFFIKPKFETVHDGTNRSPEQ